MATQFTDIYNIFLGKISDPIIASLSQSDAEALMLNYLRSATTKFKKCEKDLSNVDWDLEQFNVSLSVTEVEILVNLMVIEWYENLINDWTEIKNLLGDTDFKLYANAPLLREKVKLKDTKLNEVDRLIVAYTYESATDFSRLG